MGIIRCTAKLLTELKTKPTNQPSQSPAWCDWHANLLRVDRKKCVLFTNNQTLYSFFLPSMKKPILEHFEEVFRLGLFKSLMSERFAEPQVEYVLSEHQHIVIAKTNSRSILGSMNDLAFQVKSMIYATGGLANANLSEINRQLNRIPMSAIKYKVSIDELKRLLAEAGTEAAAATGVIMRATAMPAEPVKVTIDHPFIFLIRDVKTGAVLVVGRVLNPSL